MSAPLLLVSLKFNHLIYWLLHCISIGLCAHIACVCVAVVLDFGSILVAFPFSGVQDDPYDYMGYGTDFEEFLDE